MGFEVVVVGSGVSSRVVCSYGLGTMSSIKPGRWGYFLGFVVPKAGVPEAGFPGAELGVV